MNQYGYIRANKGYRMKEVIERKRERKKERNWKERTNEGRKKKNIKKKWNTIVFKAGLPSNRTEERKGEKRKQANKQKTNKNTKEVERERSTERRKKKIINKRSMLIGTPSHALSLKSAKQWFPLVFNVWRTLQLPAGQFKILFPFCGQMQKDSGKDGRRNVPLSSG